MTTTTMPNYDYWQRDNSMLNSLQHQSIDKNITDTGSAIMREVNAVDKHLIDGIAKVTDTIGMSTMGVRDTVNSSALGLRDSIERNALNISSNLTTAVQDSADRDRDLQVSIERTAQTGTHATERNASLLLQSIERNAGKDTRYTSAIADAANRQATNDLARDIINQTNRNDNEILSAIQTTSNAGTLATTSSGYESRTLINSNAAALQSALCSVREQLASSASQQYASLLLEQQKVKEHLSSKGSHEYASLLLEQQKVKECLSLQLADAKYEALKNKEGLSAQLAAAACDSKFEALKNTQLLSSQLAESSCQIKSSIDHVGHRLDDTLRTLDTQRLRDALNTANNEVNLLKVVDYTRDRFDNNRGGFGYGGGYGGGPGFGYGAFGYGGGPGGAGGYGYGGAGAEGGGSRVNNNFYGVDGGQQRHNSPTRGSNPIRI